MRAAYVVLAIALVPTFVAFVKVSQSARAQDAARFKTVTETLRRAIAQRITDYTDELYAIRGLFAASESVRPDEWNRYLQNLDVPKRQPGATALGYAAKLATAERETYAEPRRLDSMTGSKPHAGADEKAVRFPVLYFTNFDSSAVVAGGFDLAASRERRASLQEAAATGSPVAGDETSGSRENGGTNDAVFIYLPVYRNDAPCRTAEERKDALQGFVFVAFDPGKMLEELPPQPGASSVKLWVFDGPTLDKSALIYRPVDSGSDVPFQQSGSEFRNQISLPVLDQTWTLCFAPEPRFEAESQRYLAWLTLAGGMAASLLLFGIAWIQARARVQAEQGALELQRSESALAAEKELLAVTLQSLAEGVVSTDDSGVILSANPAAEDLLELGANVLGKPLAEVFRAAQERSHEPYPNLAETVLHSGEIAAPHEAAVLTCRDGSKLTLACSAAPVRNRDGRIFGAVIVFRDVTERRKTEEELLRESKLESVGLLAGGIAHDFNNILTGIIGNISLARMFSHSTEKMLERLVGVEKSAMRARDLTQQLLTFAKGGSPIRRPMQLQPLVKEACQFGLRGSKCGLRVCHRCRCPAGGN